MAAADAAPQAAAWPREDRRRELGSQSPGLGVLLPLDQVPQGIAVGKSGLDLPAVGEGYDQGAATRSSRRRTARCGRCTRQPSLAGLPIRAASRRRCSAALAGSDVQFVPLPGCGAAPEPAATSAGQAHLAVPGWSVRRGCETPPRRSVPWRRFCRFLQQDLPVFQHDPQFPDAFGHGVDPRRDPPVLADPGSQPRATQSQSVILCIMVSFLWPLTGRPRSARPAAPSLPRCDAQRGDPQVGCFAGGDVACCLSVADGSEFFVEEQVLLGGLCCVAAAVVGRFGLPHTMQASGGGMSRGPGRALRSRGRGWLGRT